MLTFVAPLVVEPLFNRFTPLADPELAAELDALARRAGLPLKEVLVADASRRTRKANAYVSGLGATRRLVVYDTLLERATRPEVALVLAHELGTAAAATSLKGVAGQGRRARRRSSSSCGRSFVPAGCQASSRRPRAPVTRAWSRS